MVHATNDRWSRLKEFARRHASALLRPASSDTFPRPDCLARRYAQCNDFSHCRHCSTVEQALRTAAWVERHWPHVQARKRSAGDVV